MFKKISPGTVALSVTLFIACTFIGTLKAFGQTPPSGFASVTVSGQWNEAVGLTFSADGTDMFVWERGGRVWVVTDNQKRLLLDISEEVGAWHDLGMLGFTLHPDFDQNGYFYVFYTVDRHHLINFGTAAYNPATNNYFSATINRLTRYTATKSGSVYSVVPSSRKILIGATKSTGVPQLSPTHGPGSLVFGMDKTLLVSVGDGSAATFDIGSHPASYSAQALADGILTPKENIGTFRCQSLEMFNGKILRINPETGEGIPSNPFYDPARPFAPISCVYALGVRQPFRMNKKPGTGSHNPADGNPGILYIGDVGWSTFEGIDVVDRPAMNFGWPIYEGLTPSPLATYYVPNVDAPNPLYQVDGCNQQYFNYQDLIKQPTLSGNTSFPNPCNPGQNIPSSIKTFVHTRPLIDWRHTNALSRTGIFNGETAGVINIGAPGSPVSGPQFFGSAAVGGVFYTGDDFPPEYRNTFFFGDYSAGWIRNMVVDDANKPIAVRNFIDNNAIVVAMTTHPTEEGLYYINFPSEIRRVYYSSNRPPVAVASVNNKFGPSPLAVAFTGINSVDPENQPLLFEWNFGDGSALSTIANPSHSFTAPPGIPTKYTVTLTVTDNQGETSQATVIISVNNTPPQVSIASPMNNSLYTLNEETTYSLQATVTDQEHNPSQLTYGWQTILHHEDHSHPSPIDNSPTSTTVISPVGCDGETYFYQIVLNVTDPAGGSTTEEVSIYPDCDNTKFNPLITWVNPAPITHGTMLSTVQLNAVATHNGSAVPGTFTYTPGIGTILESGNNQPLIVSFTPTDNSVYNTASKIVFINVTPSITTGFYRAINLNGAALSIDGNAWQASVGAPNFSYTTSGGVFTDATVTLIPSTDANRAAMIRSSIWGSNVNLAVSSVPAGTYQVWLSVWEDNNPATFSISIEGSVAQSNYNSGPAGTWRKLGPYPVNLTDGTLNISTNGGHANLSGVEIWTEGTTSQNQPPVVANPIADQTTTVGTAFGFTFAANTFSDPDAGTTLTYSATLSSGGALPSWLTFNAVTRTFSGSAGSGDTGTIDVRVTASDGAGGSISDVFALTVNAATTSSAFYRAINLNGAALSIDGNAWQASVGAPNFSYTTSGGVFTDATVTLIPSTDANRAAMIRSSIWGSNVNLAVSSVPAGTYQVWLSVWEDNNPATFSISIEGSVAQSNYNSGPAGTWRKLGPYPVNLTDGTLNISTNGGHANLSGVEIWTEGTTSQNQPPVVANPIADQTTTVGTAFGFTFAANTFSDPDAGTTLTYSATLSSGGALPSWLTFNAVTRTFSGSAGSGDTGTIDVRVTASDGAGGSISDVFALTVNAATTSSAFYRAINLNGAALSIDGNAWQASVGAPNFSYTTSGGVFTDATVTLIPSTDANRAAMIRSSIWGSNVNLAVSSVPAGTYQVWLSVWEDNNPATFSISIEGSVAQSNYNSGPAGTWRKLGPYPVNLTDGTLNISTNGGHANLSGVEIWTNNSSPSAGRLALTHTEPNAFETEFDDQSEFLAYPNPFSGMLNVEFTPRETASTQLVIYDIRGVQLRVLLKSNSQAGIREKLEIDVGDIPDGVYVLELINGKRIQHIRLAATR